jgi:large subunit ribosomal protein L30
VESPWKSCVEDDVSKLRLRQVKSGLGAPRKIRRTLEALGLKHQHSVIKPDNPEIRGMIFKVKHLVEVVPESDDAEKGS